MSKVLMFVTVKGKRSQWSFPFYGDQQHVEEWLADGLEVQVIENVIPARAARWAGAWCFLQDVWNFRNPWRKS